MDDWIEVLNENIAVHHVEDDNHCYVAVLIPLDTEIQPFEVDSVEEYLARKTAWKATLREMSEIREGIEERETARERLREAGYDDQEIPL